MSTSIPTVFLSLSVILVPVGAFAAPLGASNGGADGGTCESTPPYEPRSENPSLELDGSLSYTPPPAVEAHFRPRTDPPRPPLVQVVQNNIGEARRNLADGTITETEYDDYVRAVLNNQTVREARLLAVIRFLQGFAEAEDTNPTLTGAQIKALLLQVIKDVREVLAVGPVDLDLLQDVLKTISQVARLFQTRP